MRVSGHQLRVVLLGGRVDDSVSHRKLVVDTQSSVLQVPYRLEIRIMNPQELRKRAPESR